MFTSYLVGLEAKVLARTFIFILTLHVRAANNLASMRGCAGLSELQDSSDNADINSNKNVHNF